MKPVGQPAKRRWGMHLAHLAWLDGFPLEDGRWHVLGGAASAITGSTIATSRRAAQTLLREYRDELAERVDDVERWGTIVDRKLRWCSKPTHAGELASQLIDTLPGRSARRIRALAVGELAPALHAAVIAWATKPADLAHAVTWIVGRRGVTSHGLSTAVELASLAVLAGDAGVDAILALVAVDAIDPEQASKRASKIAEMVKGNLKNTAWPQHPPSSHTSYVIAWLVDLFVQPPDIKRRNMQLAAVADIAGAMKPWRDWFDAHESTLKRVMNQPSRKLEHGWEVFVDRIDQVEAVLHARPAVEANLHAILGGMDVIAESEAHTEAVVRLVDHVPNGSDVAYRSRLVCHCASTCAGEDHAERLAWVWTALADQLDRGAPPRVFDLFGPALATQTRVEIETEIFDDNTPKAVVRRWATLFARVARPSRFTARRVAMWMEAKLDDAIVVEVVDLAHREHHSLPVALARAAIALSDGSATAIHETFEALLDANIPDSPAQTALAALAERANRDSAIWILRAALAEQPQTVVTLATLAELVPVVKLPRWATAKSRGAIAWIDRYPAVLHPVLARLASLRDEAEAAVAKRLHTDFPDPAALRTEIETLRARESVPASLAKRLANLEQRLVAPKLPSRERVERHVAALQALAVTWGMTDMTSAVTARVIERVEGAFGLSWPNWPLDRLTLRILAALLELGDDQRALAGRLLRARTGPAPWDLRDEPANRRFADGMRARGIVMEPWLDDSPTSVTAADGTRLELAFTSDPLEVFAMGAHFETCLSPGEHNFFSVVTNAADVNKRVLYARRDGAVVGRCLYALADRGELLAFHPYAHDNKIDFGTIVREHIARLADRMNTTTATHGKVSLVLAHDWYDDGPLALAGRSGELPSLDLRHATPATIVGKVRDVLGTLDAVTLPYVLGHYDFIQRPDLMVPLGPWLLREHVDGQTMIKAAHLAWRAGARQLADQLIGDREHLLAIEFPTGAALAALRPSRALARLRATKPRHVRGWRDDEPDRQATAALAFAALHRPRQAAAIAAVVRERRDDIGRELDHELDQLARARTSVGAT